jgi:phosphonate transport system permease protein
MSEALLNAAGAPRVPPALREWQRHSTAQRLLRFAIWIVLVAGVLQSIRHVEVIPEFLLDAPQQMGDLLGRMWPPDLRFYRSGVHDALVETLHIASLGTLFSLLFAVPLGLLVAANLTHNRALNFAARLVLVSTRSVNSLVWALLFVAVFGPGALAGSLAIGCRSIGFVGKLLAEALEQTPPGPIEALQAAGAGWFQRIWYGYWPHIKPSFWSIVLLRWDINVRESAVLGLVGAGGIGMVLDTAMNLFQWDRVAIVLLAVFAVVVVAELVVTRVRQKVF